MHATPIILVFKRYGQITLKNEKKDYKGKKRPHTHTNNQATTKLPQIIFFLLDVLHACFNAYDHFRSKFTDIIYMHVRPRMHITQ